MRDPHLEAFISCVQLSLLATPSQSAPSLVAALADRCASLRYLPSRLIAERVVLDLARRSSGIPSVVLALERISAGGPAQRSQSRPASPTARPLKLMAPDRCGSEALAVIARRYNEQSFGLRQLSRELHVSTFHLCRAIHRHSGTPFREFLRATRLNAARDLLECGREPIKAISFLVGYKQPSHFCRQFKAVFGTTPQQFRLVTQQCGATKSNREP